MKYKVGDKVKDNGYGYPNVHDGLIGVVESYSHCGRYCYVKFPSRDDVWCYLDEELELVAPKVYIQAGNTYKDQNSREHTCLFVEGNNAYCVSGEGATAYVWEADTGKAVSLSIDKSYDLHIPVVETKVGSVVFTDGTPNWDSWKEI